MALLQPIHWLKRAASALPPAKADLAFDRSAFSPPIHTELLILQPTPFCNIACKYCYLPHRDDVSRMSMETVRQAASRLRDDGLLGERLTVIWHAGEPLTVPPAFYREAFAVITEVLGTDCAVSHSFQTNAMLINEEWCELFRRYDVRIGVSIDGPAGLHDAQRVTRGGKGTHARVMAGIGLLRKYRIPFHSIAVVTSAAFAQAEQFYQFFAQLGTTELGCNFDEAEGGHATSSLNGTESDHAGFLARLLELSTHSEWPLRIREFATAFDLIAHALPTYRWHGKDWPFNSQTMPFAIISVSHDGGFCSFSPELLGQPSAEFADFVMGNVAAGGYLAAAGTPRFQRLWAGIVAGTEHCERVCTFYSYCGGGAPANKLYENGSLASAETLYCRTMLKRPFLAVLEHFEQITTHQGDSHGIARL